MPREKLPKGNREENRQERKAASDLVAKLAKRLMALEDAELAKLGLEQDLLYEVEQARRITSMGARRREERRLARVLRAHNADDVLEKLDKARQADQIDVRCFKIAESWRDRLIAEEGAFQPFVEEFSEADPKQWHRWVNDARRQQTTGKPKGASKLLFRQVMAVVLAQKTKED